MLLSGDDEDHMESSYQNSRQESPNQNTKNEKSSSSLRLATTCAVLTIIGAFSTILYSTVQPLQSEGQSSLEIAAKAVPEATKVSNSLLPNIIFILADDMGFNSLSSEVSPSLVALRDQGINLITYYAQETCTPGRAALLTGRYPLSVGLQYYECAVENVGGLSLDETLISEVMKSGGYSTYMFGKWNLGNSSPRYLPTARGFDYYLGFLDGFSNYWSKLIPDMTTYKDFLWSNLDCYYMYDSSDESLYSTHLYEDKAVSAISTHDFSSPMFMYMAFQAVHDPFSDVNDTHSTGIPSSFLTDSAYAYISETYDGDMEFQYFKSLNVMDTAVQGIVDALDAAGVLDNTYILFASDNGGCPGGGSRNYPLRGTKGSLFEGGIHVESFIYSPLLSAVSPMNYSGLFHVSDWFPTILSMANITYTAPDDYALDGYNHMDNIYKSLNGRTDARSHLLVNYYYNSADPDSTLWTGVPMAIMNTKFKLVHTYENTAGSWYNETSVYSSYDDMIDVFADCGQKAAVSVGTFTYYLFDLVNDPEERTNLYNSSTYHIEVQDGLYAKLAEYVENSMELEDLTSDNSCYTTWAENSDYAVPWTVASDVSDLIAAKADITYPSNCGLMTDMSASAKLLMPAFVSHINHNRAEL